MSEHTNESEATMKTIIRHLRPLALPLAVLIGVAVSSDSDPSTETTSPVTAGVVAPAIWDWG